MILFTDAVFAIAITLLVLDVKVPVIPPNGTDKDFINAMYGELPKFVSFLMSFSIIGLYWYLHHRMFGYVINYTPRLIYLNLLYLLSIVLMPISTAIYSEYSIDQSTLLMPFAVYVANISFTGFAHYRLLSYIYNPQNHVTEELPSKANQDRTLKRALVLPLIFIASLLLSFVTPYGRFVLFAIPIFMRLLRPIKYESPDEN